MTKRHADAFTGELFSSIPRPAPAIAGGMDYRTQVAVIFGDMLAAAKVRDPELERPMIAAKIARLTGKDVSKAMLDGYTAESRDAFNLPLYLVPAAETVCHSTELSSWLAGIRGGRLVLGPEAIDATIGRLQRERADLDERLKHLKHLSRSAR